MRRLAVVVSVLVIAGLALAQAPAGPPKPGPEHKRMEYFVGKWNGAGDSKESPFGPAGKFTSTQTCQWMAGGFHVVCNSIWNSPVMGEVKSLSIMGYDAEEKVYTYYEASSTGEAFLAKGTVKDKLWTWNSTSKMGGKTIKSRFILNEEPPNVQAYKFEMGTGNAPMALIMEGKSTRAK